MGIEGVFVELGITFTICLIGAICKDYYNTLAKVEKCVQIPRILLSAITGTISIYSFNLKNRFGDRLFLLICFIGGIIGLELFSRIKSLDVEKIMDYIRKK